MYVGAMGEAGGREGQPLVELCTKRWVGGVFFFFLTEGGWRKGKEGGVLSPDVRQRVEKQCVPKRCLHLECVSAAPSDALEPQYSGKTGRDNRPQLHLLLRIKIRIKPPPTTPADTPRQLQTPLPMPTDPFRMLPMPLILMVKMGFKAAYWG